MRSHTSSKGDAPRGAENLQEKKNAGELRGKKRTPKRSSTIQGRRQKRRIERSIRAQAVSMENMTAIHGKPIVAFDLELAGTFPDDIIEIGAIRLQEGTDRVAVFHELIRPRTFINQTVRKMTGLDKEDFKGKESLPDILPAFLRFVGDDAVVLGHAVGDNDILSINLALARIARTTGQRRRFCPPYMDTVRLAKKLLPKDTKKFNLEILLQRFGWKARQKHRALDDAIGAYLLFQCLLDATPQGLVPFPNLFSSTEGKTLVRERFEPIDIGS